jgi:hypothetical protein
MSREPWSTSCCLDLAGVRQIGELAVDRESMQLNHAGGDSSRLAGVTPALPILSHGFGHRLRGGFQLAASQRFQMASDLL